MAFARWSILRWPSISQTSHAWAVNLGGDADIAGQICALVPLARTKLGKTGTHFKTRSKIRYGENTAEPTLGPGDTERLDGNLRKAAP